MYSNDLPPVKRTTLTGHTIARNHRTPAERAALAADIVLGDISFVKPTKVQLASIFKISVVEIDRELRARRELELDRSVENARHAKPNLEDVIREAGVARAWEIIEKMIA